MTDRKTLVERQARLEKLLDEFRRRVSHISGIVDVGIGLKHTGGKWTDQISFQIFVRQKAPLSTLSPDQIIPTEFQGIPVDVIEVTSSGPTADSSEHRPLVGGIQIVTSKGGGAGTLGCLARRTTPQAEPVLLSNHHVLSTGGAVAGDEVGQPTYTDSCCCTCGDVAVILAGGQQGGLVDCAIAQLKSGIGWDARIRIIGAVAGTNAAVVGEPVRKVGRSSDLTSGTVSSITFPTTSGSIAFNNQILVAPTSGNFQIGGDSGAALVNAANEVIGLMWGRNPGSTGPNGVASPIAAVLSTLSITIPTSGGTLYYGEPEPLPPLQTALQSMEAELSHSEAGRRILEITRVHREEVFRLVNHNRAVTVAWRRNEGPAMIATLMRGEAGASTPIPKTVNGVPVMNLLIAMSAALQEHGSSQLKRDLERYSLPVMQFADRAEVLGDLCEQLESVYEPVDRSR